MKYKTMVAPVALPLTSWANRSLKETAGVVAKLTATVVLRPSVVIQAGFTVKATVSKRPFGKVANGAVASKRKMPNSRVIFVRS